MWFGGAFGCLGVFVGQPSALGRPCNAFWVPWQDFNEAFVDSLGSPKRTALAPSVSEGMLFSLERSQVSGRFDAGVATTPLVGCTASILLVLCC